MMTTKNRTAPIYRIMSLFVTLAIGYACSAGETASTAGKTFAWERHNMHFYDAARFGDDTVRQQLETAIVAGLEERGMRFVSSIESADLELSYVAVLKDAATPEEVTAFWQANPDIAGMADVEHRFERGMLYAKLVNRISREKVWDNTYRGLVALDMPGAPREERMNELMAKFLSTYGP
jgi:Domain of unknown function (DUF4136)